MRTLACVCAPPFSGPPGILKPLAHLDDERLMMPTDWVPAVVAAVREEASQDAQESKHGGLVAGGPRTFMEAP
jgi:hypothetical protein